MFFIIMFLSISQVGRAQSNLNTLGLTIEDTDFSVAKATEEIRVSLVFTLTITQTQILQALAILNTTAVEWQASSCFEGTSPLKDQLFKALEPGQKALDLLKQKYLRFYNYIEEKVVSPASTCIFEIKMFNDLIITEEPKQLVNMRTGFSLTGTATDIWNKKDVVRAAAEFSIAYNSLISSMSSELDESLSGLNILSELNFPQNMRGNLETLPCLTVTGADFETIEVLHCKKASGKFICEITVLEPATVTSYIKLLPIVYEDVCIHIPLNSFLVKDQGTSKINILNCDDVQLAMPTCTVSEDYTACTTSLQEHDIDASIQTCTFVYSSTTFAIRLGNEAILIHGHQLSVTDNAKPVIQRPPLLVFSNSEVKVSSLFEEKIFKPTVVMTNPRVEISKVTGGQVAAMKVKAYWTKLWNYVLNSDLFNYLSLALEVVFGPMTIIGLCLSCRRRTASRKVQAKVVRKQSRKENYERNMSLLNSRNSRSSRR
jgi:hypothetical protein